MRRFFFASYSLALPLAANSGRSRLTVGRIKPTVQSQFARLTVVTDKILPNHCSCQIRDAIPASVSRQSQLANEHYPEPIKGGLNAAAASSYLIGSSFFHSKEKRSNDCHVKRSFPVDIDRRRKAAMRQNDQLVAKGDENCNCEEDCDSVSVSPPEERKGYRS